VWVWSISASAEKAETRYWLRRDAETSSANTHVLLPIGVVAFFGVCLESGAFGDESLGRDQRSSRPSGWSFWQKRFICRHAALG